MAKKKKTKADEQHWLVPFMEFREKVRPLLEHGLEFYHGVFLTRSVGHDEAVRTAKELEPAYRASYREMISFQVSENVWAYHAFYASDQNGFLNFRQAVLNMDRQLGSVPPAVLPQQERVRLVTATGEQAEAVMIMVTHGEAKP